MAHVKAGRHSIDVAFKIDSEDFSFLSYLFDRSDFQCLLNIYDL